MKLKMIWRYLNYRQVIQTQESLAIGQMLTGRIDLTAKKYYQ